MPQIILLTIIGAIAYVGYRSLTKEAERVHREVRDAERERENNAHGTLIKDPKTGEYRPRRPDDD